jgi:transcription elongation factor GreA
MMEVACMSKEVYLTPKGYEELEKKLEYLKVICRREVAEKIKAAREFGDISENAEYDTVKEEQAMIEGEIYEIEQKLKSAKIINEENIDTSEVNLGCTITLFDFEYKEEITYKIVGTAEADPSKNMISNESPVGKAALGKHKGDIIIVDTPGGKSKFQILDIRVK